MFIDSCSDEFVQVWFPSVRLTDVLSLQQQMIYCVVGPRVESVDSSRSFRPLLCPHVRTFKHFASVFYPFYFIQFGMQNGTIERDVPGFRFNSPSVHSLESLFITSKSTNGLLSGKRRVSSSDGTGQQSCERASNQRASDSVAMGQMARGSQRLIFIKLVGTIHVWNLDQFDLNIQELLHSNS